MNGLGMTILVGLLLFSWWQWAEKDRYKELYHKALCSTQKKLPETKEEEQSLGVEYDENLPHPFK